MNQFSEMTDEAFAEYVKDLSSEDFDALPIHVRLRYVNLLLIEANAKEERDGA